MPTITHLAGQHSSDSTATVLSTWHQSLPPSVVLQTTTGAPMHQASISSSRLSLSTAAATFGSRRTGAATVLPAKKVAKGKKVAPAAGARASGIQADVSTDATGAGAVAGGQAAAPVKRKRGPYKKRVKKEGEETAAIARKKKMISMMPAVEAFAKRSQQQGAASGQLPVSLPGCHQQGPSKRARCASPAVFLASCTCAHACSCSAKICHQLCQSGANRHLLAFLPWHAQLHAYTFELLYQLRVQMLSSCLCCRKNCPSERPDRRVRHLILVHAGSKCPSQAACLQLLWAPWTRSPTQGQCSLPIWLLPHKLTASLTLPHTSSKQEVHWLCPRLHSRIRRPLWRPLVTSCKQPCRPACWARVCRYARAFLTVFGAVLPLILPYMVMLPLHVMRLQHTNQLVKAGAPCV